MAGHIHDRTYYSGSRILSLLCWSRCIGWIVKKPQKTNAPLAKKTSPQSHRRNHTFATHDTTHYIKAIANHSEWKRHYPANASYQAQAILRPCNTTLTSLSWSQTYSSLKNSLWAASLETIIWSFLWHPNHTFISSISFIALSVNIQIDIHMIWNETVLSHQNNILIHSGLSVRSLEDRLHVADTPITPLHPATLSRWELLHCYKLHRYKMRRPPSLTPGHQLLHLI